MRAQFWVICCHAMLKEVQLQFAAPMSVAELGLLSAVIFLVLDSRKDLVASRRGKAIVTVRLREVQPANGLKN